MVSPKMYSNWGGEAYVAASATVAPLGRNQCGCSANNTGTERWWILIENMNTMSCFITLNFAPKSGISFNILRFICDYLIYF